VNLAGELETIPSHVPWRKLPAYLLAAVRGFRAGDRWHDAAWRAARRSGCLLAGPGRGDCEHFVGLPAHMEYPRDIDEYGVPHGWCLPCWRAQRTRATTSALRALTS
jgi:hypothetical protein